MRFPLSDCARCQSTGRTCEWYAPAQPQSPREGQGTEPSQIRSVWPKHSLAAVPDSGDDMHYLQFYHQCVGPRVSGRFDTEFWLRTVLQMAHAEPGVRSALVALSLLNKRQNGSLQHARQLDVITSAPERKIFLVNYNKAIRHLIEDMARPSFPADAGLVICLLFACIEFLQADANVAFAHIRSGLSIFHELKLRNKPVSAVDLADASHNRISLRWSGIEQVLVQLLTNALASALPYGVSLEKDFEYFALCPEHFAGTTFATLNDARSSFSDLRNTALLMARDMAIKIFKSTSLTPSDYRRQHALLQRHEAWVEGLTELENSHVWTDDEKTALSALKVEYYSSFTACSCLTDKTQMSFDAHLFGFKNLLMHARRLVDSLEVSKRRIESLPPDAAANFTFDTSFIPALFYASIRCRCPTTRRETLDILASDLPREGLWDAAQYHKVAERVIEIEEMNVDINGWPTEESRLCKSSVGTEIEGGSSFHVHFLYAKDVASSIDRSWTERFDLDESHDTRISLPTRRLEITLQQP